MAKERLKTTELRKLGAGAEAGARRAVEALPQAAAAAGILDVGYGFADSPFGPLLVAVTKKGLVWLAYPDREPDEELEAIGRHVSPRVMQSAGATAEVRRELDEYFDGRRRRFEIPIDLHVVRGFFREVLKQTARIPFGHLLTYRDVAARAGSPRAMRAAGNALASNPIPIVVPCHRVIHTGGGLGGYTSGLDRKRALLRLEGALP